MAWTAIDDFESYSPGNLAGGSGGSGWTGNWTNAATQQIVVSTSQAYDGVNSAQISNASGNTFYTRAVSSVTSGDVYFAMYKVATNAPTSAFTLRNTVATMSVQLDNAGNIQVLRRTPSLAHVTVGSYTANTWYYFHLEFDTTSDQYRVRWTTDGTWGSWTSYYTPRNTNNITLVGLGADSTSSHTYIDGITNADPFAGGGGPTTNSGFFAFM